MSLSDFKLITMADAARIFDGCSRKTIENYIRAGTMPAPVRFGGREYWHPADFQEFLDKTFRKGQLTTPDGELVSGQAAPEADVSPAIRSDAIMLADSNPVVRQQRRQQARLQRLNANT